MSNALDGIVVVSIEQAVAAPLCTVRLADAGARVIKVERPDGETARHYDAAVEGVSAYFVWRNRGKESTALDLKSDEDLALLHRMVAGADVFVQNLAPGATSRLGFSNEVLTAKFPGLIAVNIVGYGQDTPYAQMRAYDMLVQAESGLCAVTGTPEQACKVGVSAADIATGMSAHAAILEALLLRSKTGKGQIIEIAMFDAVADWMAVPLLHYEYGSKETKRHGAEHATIFPYRPYVCKDGGAVIISIQQNSEWKRFCTDVLQHTDLFDDERFASNAWRVANRIALDAEIEPVFASITRDEAIARLEAAQISWGKQTELKELPRHPALRRMNVNLPNGKQISLPRPAGRVAEFNAAASVPALGVDTARIRAEFAA